MSKRMRSLQIIVSLADDLFEKRPTLMLAETLDSPSHFQPKPRSDEKDESSADTSPSKLPHFTKRKCLTPSDRFTMHRVYMSSRCLAESVCYNDSEIVAITRSPQQKHIEVEIQSLTATQHETFFRFNLQTSELSLTRRAT
ncbi:hypothetical protein AVEN_208209-1 [Araneus ventricosus]|uniref:Uncharacterized protein n=1 Tax=Araneus ventricosus TaxID=182803 RepID=A0A4Y2LH55_ARAVE|nr:hypothetical protein AVEN_208209-1 [Araneus ventricosus]